MSVKVKSIRCKTCDTTLENPTREMCEYVYNACTHSTKVCGLSKVDDKHFPKGGEVVYFHDKTPAWFVQKSSDHKSVVAWYDKPLEGKMKGKSIGQ